MAAVACLVALVLSGCQAARPIRSYVRLGPSYNSTMPSVEHVGLMVDALVQYDRVSTNYYDLEDSLSAVTNLVNEALNGMRAKGYDVAYVETPFVGGFEPAEFQCSFAPKRKDIPTLQNAPFQISEVLASDPSYRDALKLASRSIHEAVLNRGELPTETLQASQMARSALSTIAAKKNARYLLVIQGEGVVVSGGKQVGQEIGTTLVSVLISGGNVVARAHNVSFLDSTASLVDLQNSEILWSNSLRLGGLNPANPDHYKARWAQNVLYWLPPKGQLETPIN